MFCKVVLGADEGEDDIEKKKASIVKGVQDKVKAKFKVPLEHAFQLLMDTSKEFLFELYRFCDVDDDGRVSGQEIDIFEKLLTWIASSTSIEGAEDEGGEEQSSIGNIVLDMSISEDQKQRDRISTDRLLQVGQQFLSLVLGISKSGTSAAFETLTLVMNPIETFIRDSIFERAKDEHGLISYKVRGSGHVARLTAPALPPARTCLAPNAAVRA